MSVEEQYARHSHRAIHIRTLDCSRAHLITCGSRTCRSREPRVPHVAATFGTSDLVESRRELVERARGVATGHRLAVSRSDERGLQSGNPLH